MGFREWYKTRSESGKHHALDSPIGFADTGNSERFKKFLSNYEFIETKIFDLNSQAIIDDYALTEHPNIQLSDDERRSLKYIQKALQQIQDVIDYDNHQLPGQLLSKLINLEDPLLDSFLKQIKEYGEYPWLRPVKVNLIALNQPLVYTITTYHPAVTAIVISNDGKLALTAGKYDGVLKLWNLSNRELLHTLDMVNTRDLVRSLLPKNINEESIYSITDRELREKTAAYTLAISPDGNWLASGSFTSRLLIDKGYSKEVEEGFCVVELWDLTEPKSVLTFAPLEFDDAISCIALSSGGNYCLVGTVKGEIIICNLEEKQKNQWHNNPFYEKRFVGIANDGQWTSVRAVALSSNARWALAASDNLLKIWDLEAGDLYRLIPLRGSMPVKKISINRQGNILILFGDGTLGSLHFPKCIENTTVKPKSIARLQYPPLYVYKRPIFKSYFLASIVSKVKIFFKIFWIRLTKARYKIIQFDRLNLSHNIVPNTISSDARWAISCKEDGGIQLWDLMPTPQSTK
ncbi:MAG: hypothetical protein AAGA80_04710 [Cyanobacteria bacterium P01_F01_bin.143]